MAAAKEFWRAEGQAAATGSLAFSPDGKVLASGGHDGIVRLWDAATGKELRRLQGHQEEVRSLSFSPDGKLLASGTGPAHTDRTIRLWDVATGRELRRFPGGYLSSVAFSPDGKTLATSRGDGAIRLWDPATGKELDPCGKQPAYVQSVAVSPDGKTVAAAGYHEGNTVALWDVAAGQVTRLLTGHQHGLYGVAFSPDGKLLASAGRDGTVRLWHASTGNEVRSLRAQQGGVPSGAWLNCVAFSPDGKTVAASSRDSMVRLWDVATGKEVRRFEGHQGPVWSVAFAPDGKTLATGSADRTVRLWEVATGQEFRQLTGHEGDVEAVAISPDGKVVASSGRDGTVRFWQAATGRLLYLGKEPPHWTTRLDLHLDGKTLAFSPDGRSLASGSWQAVQLWEVATGRERRRFVGHRGEVVTVAFAPDGRTLVSGSPDTTMLVWDVGGRRGAGGPEAGPRTPEQLEALGAGLSAADAAEAYDAVCTLTAIPGQAVPFLQERLRPVARADIRRAARLIADLDHDDFVVREKATGELENLGRSAETVLVKTLEGRPSVEVRRRVQMLLEKLQDQEWPAAELQTLRAVEVLERIGTSEARQFLTALAQGAPEARLTQEAEAALRRLDKRRAATPRPREGREHPSH